MGVPILLKRTYLPRIFYYETKILELCVIYGILEFVECSLETQENNLEPHPILGLSPSNIV